MLIVYRKSDKEILYNSGTSFIEPEGMSDVNGKLAVIELIGGTFDDYGTYRLHDVNDKVKVDEILKYKDYVSLVFENDEAVGYAIDFIKYENDMQIQAEQEKEAQKITEIQSLKQQLADTDYKIVKCSEYQLAGLELPYDIAVLNTERQAIRDSINQLESQMN